MGEVDKLPRLFERRSGVGKAWGDYRDYNSGDIVTNLEPFDLNNCAIEFLLIYIDFITPPMHTSISSV
jgi:hypothetical protein